MPEGRYLSYIRVSTVKQGQSGLGLEGQRAAVQNYLNGGRWSLLGEFVEVESGKKNNRPELSRALAACRVKKATLIIAKIDRLARNSSFLMGIIDSGVDVVFCDLPQILVGAAGRFMLQQMASVAELEAGLISERTKAALKAKVARDGQWDRHAGHHLVPGAGQSAAVEARQRRAQDCAEDLRVYIDDARAAGITTLRGLAQALAEHGIASPGGSEWTATTVRRLLLRLDGARAT
ncbi:resolvase [Paramagnetospirillum kuznetsovii]|uniref:Resolvase n=1 Tax=Paramagnetospirillum kuznetsovii TaxID=2053833 RepID=A0A364P071_9PROT|nr:recombinase family protein [Paramagnetospirillum kuznetsovii]RAU22738.1 resolvase [Paramagnetospirillum kuznetsovii]